MAHNHIFRNIVWLHFLYCLAPFSLKHKVMLFYCICRNAQVCITTDAIFGFTLKHILFVPNICLKIYIHHRCIFSELIKSKFSGQCEIEVFWTKRT